MRHSQVICKTTKILQDPSYKPEAVFNKSIIAMPEMTCNQNWTMLSMPSGNYTCIYIQLLKNSTYSVNSNANAYQQCSHANADILPFSAIKGTLGYTMTQTSMQVLFFIQQSPTYKSEG